MVTARIFAVLGFILSGLAAAVLVASFASPYWVSSDTGVMPSGFENMGLWVICFHNYYPVNRPITNKKYEGCWASISYEMSDLQDHFYPGWMNGVQAMVTMATLMTIGSLILNIVYFIHCCPVNLDKILVLVSFCMGYVSALFLVISVMVFGLKVDQDRDWLPYPDLTFLDWAYGMAILGCFLCLFYSMCMTTEFFRIRLEFKYDDRREPSNYSSARYSAPPPSYDHRNKPRY